MSRELPLNIVGFRKVSDIQKTKGEDIESLSAETLSEPVNPVVVDSVVERMLTDWVDMDRFKRRLPWYPERTVKPDEFSSKTSTDLPPAKPVKTVSLRFTTGEQEQFLQRIDKRGETNRVKRGVLELKNQRNAEALQYHMDSFNHALEEINRFFQSISSERQQVKLRRQLADLYALDPIDVLTNRRINRYISSTQKRFLTMDVPHNIAASFNLLVESKRRVKSELNEKRKLERRISANRSKLNEWETWKSIMQSGEVHGESTSDVVASVIGNKKVPLTDKLYSRLVTVVDRSFPIPDNPQNMPQPSILDSVHRLNVSFLFGAFNRVSALASLLS